MCFTAEDLTLDDGKREKETPSVWKRSKVKPGNEFQERLIAK